MFYSDFQIFFTGIFEDYLYMGLIIIMPSSTIDVSIYNFIYIKKRTKSRDAAAKKNRYKRSRDK